MSEALLPRIKAKLRLNSRHRSSHLLHGQHAAFLRGRSFDFDDLREYVPGDEVATIDWNASARSGSTLVRQFLDERRQRVCILVDSGRDMSALANPHEVKKDIAITAAGALGYVALRNGHEVGAVLGSSAGVRLLPYRTSEGALERVLRQLRDTAQVRGSQSDFVGMLQFALRHLRGRALLVIVADEIPVSDALREVVARLQTRHDVIWLEVADASPVNAIGVDGEVTDVDGSWQLPRALQGSKRLTRALAEKSAQRTADFHAELKRLGVSVTRIQSESEAISLVLGLLRERSHVRR